jgi:hypothetical protein
MRRAPQHRPNLRLHRLRQCPRRARHRTRHWPNQLRRRSLRKSSSPLQTYRRPGHIIQTAISLLRRWRRARPAPSLQQQVRIGMATPPPTVMPRLLRSAPAALPIRRVSRRRIPTLRFSTRAHNLPSQPPLIATRKRPLNRASRNRMPLSQARPRPIDMLPYRRQSRPASRRRHYQSPRPRLFQPCQQHQQLSRPAPRLHRQTRMRPFH